jgi:flagellar motor switch protein FliN/FliY
LASDISNIIKSEIINTLESLLSISVSVNDVESVPMDGLDDQQCIKVDSKFAFSGVDTVINYLIPAATATKFEYLMLGGVTDLKDNIDDEIADAVKEIISTMCGSITTNINAQGFADVSDVKFELTSSGVIQCNEMNNQNKIYKFYITMNDETLLMFMAFDDIAMSHVQSMTEDVVDTSTDSSSSVSQSTAVSPASSVLGSLLGEESVENLRLLFDIKLRLSVRLGTKVCLLRDVISWDIGEIIELSQMTSEPLDILVNGVVIGQGEAIIVDGKFGVKIKHIGDTKIS